MTKKLLALLALSSIALLSPQAGAQEPPDITVEDARAFATADLQKNGAVFMTLRNAGTADRLTGAAGDAAERIELHGHVMEDGAMAMRRVKGVNIPSRGEAILEPAGYHIMLMGLKAPLQAGASFPLTLSFTQHADVTVDVTVVSPAAHH